MARAYKDDVAIRFIKFSLTPTTQVVESMASGFARQKEILAERSTCGSTIEEFRNRISKELAKLTGSHHTSPSVHKIIDKFRPEISKMFANKETPIKASKDLIAMHEDGPVGFTHYNQHSKSLAMA